MEATVLNYNYSKLINQVKVGNDFDIDELTDDQVLHVIGNGAPNKDVLH